MSDELPKGWATASLSTIAEINPRHSKDLDGVMPVTFVPMAALSESKPGFQFTEERPLGEVRKGFTHFAERDVLFAKITPCMENGKGAVARGLQNKLGCGTTELHVIRPLADISAEYIYRFLAQDKVRRAAKENFTGTAGQARVPTSFIEELEVPLAPLAEQRRIVAKLETLMGKVDACQQRLTEIPVLLKRFRQSVLAAACSGRLTADWREERTTDDSDKKPSVKSAKSVVQSLVRDDAGSAEDLPDGWRNAPFSGFIESSFYGPRFGKESYASEGVPTIRTTDMGFDGSIVMTDTPRIKLSSKELEKYCLQHGDFVVTRTGATIGKCAVYDKSRGPAIPGAYLIRFRFKQDLVVPKYVLRFFMSPVGQNLLVGGSNAVAQPNVNATTISRFLIPVPPLPEQQEIVRRVEGLFALADQLEMRLAKARGQVDQITPSLLARAFAGKLVPQDPTDEPASNLLQRIRTAASSASETTKRKSKTVKE